ncbi:MAG: hypothetical protein K2Z81_12920 [Cyanobacteria bacterium]|nr:hypothetical protein [Cyanobacteriota bacterium]
MICNLCIIISVCTLILAIRFAKENRVTPMLFSAVTCILALLVIYPVADDQRRNFGESSPVTVQSFKRYYTQLFADNPRQVAPARVIKKRRVRTS